MRFCLFGPSTILVASALVACSDTTKPAGKAPMTVSFATAPSSGAALSLSPEAGALRSVTVTSGSDVLVINTAQVVVARMELQRSGASCTSKEDAGDDHADEDRCAELAVEPTVIDLPVDAAVITGLNVAIPAGTYSALEAQIRPVRGHGPNATAFLTAHPEFAGASIRVTGTFNGKDFTYTGSPRAEFEKEFDPPLTVGTAPVNLTVHADLSNWFKTESGALIDPATANADGPNANTVAQNIRRSFRAFRDHDHDGHDDDDHGHG